MAHSAPIVDNPGRGAAGGRGGRRARSGGVVTARSLTLDELRDELARGGLDVDAVWPQLARWVARGDGVALYANALLGDPNAAEVIAVSFGSATARLEADTPPDTLPDFHGRHPGWRFRLVGTYRPSHAAAGDVPMTAAGRHRGRS
jgi:hypothetical protein